MRRLYWNLFVWSDHSPPGALGILGLTPLPLFHSSQCVICNVWRSSKLARWIAASSSSSSSTHSATRVVMLGQLLQLLLVACALTGVCNFVFSLHSYCMWRRFIFESEKPSHLPTLALWKVSAAARHASLTELQRVPPQNVKVSLQCAVDVFGTSTNFASSRGRFRIEVRYGVFQFVSRNGRWK